MKNRNNNANPIDVLVSVGIVTMADLDAYRFANPMHDGNIESRYGTLRALIGEQAADTIMRWLEIRSW